MDVCWFVLNYFGLFPKDTAAKIVERFNKAELRELELFAPTYVVREERDGQVKFREAKLTFHYMFVRGTLTDVKLLCQQDNGFSLLLDRGSEERYAIISDSDMAGFRQIARAYKNCLPYYPLGEIDLEAGDLVEVVHGDFPGLVGRYMPKTKSNSGNIVLEVYNKVGAIAFDIKASDVRVLEFSKKSTRLNDQIDAFVPHLLKALLLYSRNETLPLEALAKLNVFCSRMETTRVSNRKLNAKLQALLAGAFHILGNKEAAGAARRKYDALAATLTNKWTQALTNLIFAVVDEDKAALAAARERTGELTPTSKAQHELAAAYGEFI